jgi:hypothetical protein
MEYSEFVQYVLAECEKVRSDITSIDHALKHFCVIEKGWVAEFGVYNGSSLKKIREGTPQNIPVVGFDCFTGLPETWRVGFGQGMFNLNGNIPQIMDNTIIVKGLFDAVLPQVMLLLGDKPLPLRLLHIDCDLYSSTRTVFEKCKDSIVSGTVIVFDELVEYQGFEEHEMKAFYEFIQATNHRFDVLVKTGETVAVRII